MREAYVESGVDVEAGYKAVSCIKEHAAATAREEVIAGVGGFGALFSAKSLLTYKDPVLVSGTDGVGTKLQIAILTDRHETVGRDLVAMCVNDIVCCGAEPLFFLDYIAAGKVNPEKIGKIVGGIAEGCVCAGCALIGGETAEHPGMMGGGDYDMAGFAVGAVERSKIIDGSRIKPGDKIIGLASSGVHSNGFSLIRKILHIPGAVLTPGHNSLHNAAAKGTDARERLNMFIPPLGKRLGDELLEPTRIYVKPMLALMKEVDVLGAAHITGGGLIENIPRVLPKGCKAVIRKGAWKIPPVFEFLMDTGGYRPEDFYGIFNMGIGMAVIVRAEEAEKAAAVLKAEGEEAFVAGEIAEGEGIKI